MSACIAARLSMVSSSDSPLLVLEAEMLRLMTSADSRLDAISNVVRVRVEFSKNRLNTLFPRIRGTFFTSRSPMLTKEDAVSRMRVMTALGSPSTVSKCCSSPCLFSCGLCMVYRKGKAAVGGTLKNELLPLGKRDGVSDNVGRNRQFAAAAVDQRRQHDFRRTAIVEQFIDRGARGAARIQHVVHQQDGRAVDFERYLRRFDVCMQSLFRIVVAIKGDVDESQAIGELQFRRQPLGQPCAAGADADDRGMLGIFQCSFHLLGKGRIQGFRVEFKIGHIHRNIVAGLWRPPLHRSTRRAAAKSPPTSNVHPPAPCPRRSGHAADLQSAGNARSFHARRHPDGAEHEMTVRCRRFANQLHGRFGVDTALVDERYSSAVISQRRDELIDAKAAAIILQQYFDEYAQS